MTKAIANPSGRIAALACACAVCGAVALAAQGACAPQSAFASSSSEVVKIAGTYRNADAKAVLKKVNAKRSKADAKKLRLDKRLQRAAATLAAEQAVFYGTARPSGKNWSSAVPGSYRPSANLRRTGAYAVTRSQAAKELYRKADKGQRSAGIACFETEGQRYWVLVTSRHAAKRASIKHGAKKKTVSVKARTWMLGDIEIEKTNSAPALVYMKDVGLSCRVRNKGAGNGASFTAQNARFASSDPKVLQVEGKIARSVGSGPASVLCSIAGKSAVWETHCYVNVIKGAIWEVADNAEMDGAYKIDSDTGMGLSIPPTQEYAYCRYTSYIEYDGVRTYGKTTEVFKVRNERYVGTAQKGA